MLVQSLISVKFQSVPDQIKVLPPFVQILKLQMLDY